MAQNVTTLDNCTILTMDEWDHHYVNGRIVIADNIITAIGDADDIKTQGEILDMQGRLVMPGFVNTHTHSHSSIFRNTADDLSLMDWLKTAMWPMEKHLSAERAYVATLLSCLEYIRSGITCYADQFYFSGIVAKAAMNSGLRTFLAATVFTNPSAETEDTFSAAVDFVEKYCGKQNETLVYPCIGPHAPYSVNEHLWRECTKLSAQYDLLIHTHISETIDENRKIMEQTGLSPTRWLHNMGVFERPVLAAHSIHLDDVDMDLYARYKVAVAYNPVSNLKLVSGIMPMKRLLEKGILVTIGTDGAQSNNSMDLLRDLRTGILLQKQVNEDASFLGGRFALRMATIEGAKALGIDSQIGSLELGKKADLIAFDTTSPRLCPLHRSSVKNLYAAICYSACGADVSDSMVNGRWLMRNQTVLSLDAPEVLKEAQKASEYLVKHSGIEI